MNVSTNPGFSHIIALDFECTCWDENIRLTLRDREIIEFPAVLVNVTTGKIEAEFHQYLKPVEDPILSDYCKNLLGISQETVNNGVLLVEALKMFHNWLRKELNARGLFLPFISHANSTGSVAFATWTDYDLGHFLDKECKRKNLTKPPYFNEWIDMRTIYKSYVGRRAGNFAESLQSLGIKSSGSIHSGIADARKVGEMAHHLVKKGVKLTITKNLQTKFFDIDENI